MKESSGEIWEGLPREVIDSIPFNVTLCRVTLPCETSSCKATWEGRPVGVDLPVLQVLRSEEGIFPGTTLPMRYVNSCSEPSCLNLRPHTSQVLGSEEGVPADRRRRRNNRGKARHPQGLCPNLYSEPETRNTP